MNSRDEPSLRALTEAQLEAAYRAAHARLNPHHSWDDYEARRMKWRNGEPHETQVVAVSVTRAVIEALLGNRKDGSSLKDPQP